MKKEIDINKYVVSVLEPLNLKSETLDEVVKIIEREDKPVYFTGDAVCTNPYAEDFTKGKLYHFVNGVITDDKGDRWGAVSWCNNPVRDINEWNQLHCAKFRPAVESDYLKEIEYCDGMEVEVVSDKCYHGFPIGCKITLEGPRHEESGCTAKHTFKEMAWYCKGSSKFIIESDIKPVVPADSIPTPPAPDCEQGGRNEADL